MAELLILPIIWGEWQVFLFEKVHDRYDIFFAFALGVIVGILIGGIWMAHRLGVKW